MATNAIQSVTSKSTLNKGFLARHYHHLIYGLMGLVVLFFLCLVFLFYQLANRPLPQFYAQSTDGNTMLLFPNEEPNLLPDTIIRWAIKAATAAYTFDFVNYSQQTQAAKPYFTDQGWQDYSNSISGLISTIVDKQLFVNGVVVGAPVISNEGPLPGHSYAWRVQIPFLVTYQSANQTKRTNFLVMLSIVRVPTSQNQQGIGIDQFLMV